MVGDEGTGRIGRIVGQDADDREAFARVLVQLALEQRELLAARDAAGTPEVDHHRSSGERCKVEGDAVERHPVDGRRGATDRHAIGTARTRPRSHHEGHDTGGRDDSDEQGEDDRSARSANARYSIVAFPVIVGWTVHRNVYLPAAWAGTS